MPDPSGNGWTEYRKLVISSLEANQKRLASIERRLRVIENDITALKIKVYIGVAALSTAVSITASLLVGILK